MPAETVTGTISADSRVMEPFQAAETDTDWSVAPSSTREGLADRTISVGAASASPKVSAAGVMVKPDKAPPLIWSLSSSPPTSSLRTVKVKEPAAADLCLAAPMVTLKSASSTV